MAKSLLFDNTIGEIKSDISSGIYIFNGTTKEWTITKNPYTGFPIDNKLHKFFIGNPLANTEWTTNTKYNYGDSVIHTTIDGLVKYYVCIEKHKSSNMELLNDELISMYWRDYTKIMESINPYDFITTYKNKRNYCSSSEVFVGNKTFWRYYNIGSSTKALGSNNIITSNKYKFPSNDYCTGVYLNSSRELKDYYWKYNFENIYGKKAICSMYFLPSEGGNKYISLSISNNYLKTAYSVVFDLTTNERPIKIKDSYINPETYALVPNVRGFDINESTYGVSGPYEGSYQNESGKTITFNYYRLWVEAKILVSGNNSFRINILDTDDNGQLQYKFKVRNTDLKYETWFNGSQIEFVDTVDGIYNIEPDVYVKSYGEIKNIYVLDKIYQKNALGDIVDYKFNGVYPSVYFFDDVKDFINDTDYKNRDIAILNNYIKLNARTSVNSETISTAGAKLGSIFFPNDADNYVWSEMNTFGQISYEMETNNYYAHLNNDSLNTVKLKTRYNKNINKAILQALIYNADQYGFYSHVKGSYKKIQRGVNGGGCYTLKKW